jgi:hypothetical protein
MFYFETGALATKLVEVKGDIESLSGKRCSSRVLSEVLLCHQRFRYCYFKSASVGGSVLCDSGCQVEGHELKRVGLRCVCSHRFILSRERQERLHLAFLLVLELLASGLTDSG